MPSLISPEDKHLFFEDKISLDDLQQRYTLSSEDCAFIERMKGFALIRKEIVNGFKAGISVEQLAEKYDRAIHTIKIILSKAGLKVPYKTPVVTTDVTARKLPDEADNLIREGLPFNEIADKYGVSVSIVYSRAKSLGVYPGRSSENFWLIRCTKAELDQYLNGEVHLQQLVSKYNICQRGIDQLKSLKLRHGLYNRVAQSYKEGLDISTLCSKYSMSPAKVASILVARGIDIEAGGGQSSNLSGKERILDLLKSARRPLKATEIGEVTKLSRGALYAYLRVLVRKGLIMKLSTRPNLYQPVSSSSSSSSSSLSYSSST
jgi:hypothetical protein